MQHDELLNEINRLLADPGGYIELRDCFKHKTYRMVRNSLKGLDKLPGLYFLFQGEGLIYIGQSTNMKDRIKGLLSFYPGKEDERKRTHHSLMDKLVFKLEKMTPRDTKDLRRQVIDLDWKLKFFEMEDAHERKVIELVLIGMHAPRYNSETEALEILKRSWGIEG